MSSQKAISYLVMAGNGAAMAVRQGDPDVLHHPLVLMIENVAMQDELADVALVARPHGNRVTRRGVGAGILNPQRVLPDILQSRILRVAVIIGTKGADIIAGRIDDLDDLERIDMDMERMADDLSVHSSTPPSGSVRSMRLVS